MLLFLEIIYNPFKNIFSPSAPMVGIKWYYLCHNILSPFAYYRTFYLIVNYYVIAPDNN
jgi:hypothetical protein